jgi:polyisoprenoid-binding protein YceI
MKPSLFILFLFLSFRGTGQDFLTKNGKVSFFSSTALENIEASNNQVLSVINTKTGEMAFSILIKGFLFKKALMQEHFNEEYLESEKFPKSTFKGTLSGIGKLNLTRNGVYPVTVTGILEIHGVSKKMSGSGTLTVRDGTLSAASEFTVLLADYNIVIPKMVENSISPKIKIMVNCDYLPKK